MFDSVEGRALHRKLGALAAAAAAEVAAEVVAGVEDLAAGEEVDHTSEEEAVERHQVHPHTPAGE